jgi:hypothetical protein
MGIPAIQKAKKMPIGYPHARWTQIPLLEAILIKYKRMEEGD